METGKLKNNGRNEGSLAVGQGAGFRKQVLLSAVALVAAGVGSAQAATNMYWDADGTGTGVGGTGVWDTGSALWRSGSSSGTLTTWQNQGTAVFSYPGDFSFRTVTLNSNSADISVTSMSFEANYIVAAPTSGNATLRLVGNSTIGTTGGYTVAMRANMSGTGSLAYNGNSSAFFSVSGANTYSGGTTLSSAATTTVFTSSVGTPGSLTSSPFGTGTVKLQSGTLRAGANSLVVGNALSLDGDTVYGDYNTAHYALTLSGSATLTGTRTITTTANGGALTFSGAIGDGGNGYGIIKAGSTSTLTLAGANTYKGATAIKAGSITVGNELALQNSTLTLAASDAGIIVWGGSPAITTATFGGLSGTRNLTALPTGFALKIGNNNESTAFSGNISGTSATLEKIGAGSLSLPGGGNSYTGATTITQGSLLANNTAGSATGTGSVEVNGTSSAVFGLLGGGAGSATGGTLQAAAVGGASLKTYNPGSVGVISGTVSVNSFGHLAPGNSVGTLTLGGLTLASGSVADYEFNGISNDFTAITGTLSLNGGGLNLYQEGTTNPFTTAGVYNLFSYGTLAGSLANLTVLNGAPNATYTFSNDTADKIIQLTVAVPEPASLALLGLASGALLTRRVRRSAK